jgi:hypothetical protein
MDLLHPGPAAAESQLRALAMVAAAARDGIRAPQRGFLEAVRQVVFATGADTDPPKPITPGALAIDVGGPAEALQLIRFMVVMAVCDGPPSKTQMELVRAFAAELRVDEPAVRVIGHLAKGNVGRFRIAFLRRSHIRQYMRNTRRMAGVRGVVKGILRFRGVLPEDTETASRYRALERLPADTLGHRFFLHCTKDGISLPGEKGGFPEGAIFHDITHVLSGSDTSARGEMKNAAFQAGYTKGAHDFFTWLISVVLHATGINLTPFDVGFEPGRMGEPGLALDVLRELERGSALPRDLGDQWDYWPYMELPLDVARERLGIPRPRYASAST